MLLSISRWITIATALILSIAAPAQESGPTIHVQSDLVALDVSVTTKDGKSVPDLKASDFTVLENGVPQEIRAVDPPARHVTLAGVQVNSTADLEKLGSAAVTILVLDELNGTFEENSYSRYSIQKYLEAQPPQMREATALMVETNSSFMLLRDFTMDRAALLSALLHHSPEIPSRRMQGGLSGDAAMERVLFTMNSLEQIAKATQGYRGRKNVIWVGNALPGVNTQEMPAEDIQAINMTVERTVNLLLGSHTVLYTIDPRANSSAQLDVAGAIETMGTADSSYLSDPSTSDPFSDGQNFGMIANVSGGDAISGHNDIAKVMEQSITAGSDYYTIYYRPSVPRSTTTVDTAQQFRKLSVRVSRPGLVLVARHGYYSNTPPETQPATAESLDTKDSTNLLTMDLSSAIFSTMPYTGLYVHVIPSHDRSQVHVVLRSSQLSWTSSGNAAADRSSELVVVMAAFDAKHHMLSHHAYKVTGHLPAADSGSAFANFIFPLALPKGAKDLRVVVRDMRKGFVGSDDLSVTPVADKPAGTP